MSSTILPKCNNILHKDRFAYGKYSAVNNKRPESLAEFIKRIRNEKRLTLDAVVRASGNVINSGYLSRIENGIATNPSPKKLKALAKGLGVSNDHLFSIVQGAPLSEKELELELTKSILADFERLPESDRQYFQPLLKFIRQELDVRLERQTPPSDAQAMSRAIRVADKNGRDGGFRDNAIIREVHAVHPEIDAATVLDVIDGNLEGVTSVTIDIVREYERQFDERDSQNDNRISKMGGK